MKRLFLISFIIAASVVSAQQSFVKGYVVQLNGDTLHGEIKINPKKEIELYQKVAFKEASGLQKTFKPDKLKAYGFNNEAFIAAKIDDEPLFYKVLSSGTLYLYEVKHEVLQMNELRIKIDFFMKKKGSEDFVKIKQGRFKKQLVEQMADAADIVKEIETNKQLEIENLEQVFDQYNTWAKVQKS